MDYEKISFRTAFENFSSREYITPRRNLFQKSMPDCRSEITKRLFLPNSTEIEEVRGRVDVNDEYKYNTSTSTSTICLNNRSK